MHRGKTDSQWHQRIRPMHVQVPYLGEAFKAIMIPSTPYSQTKEKTNIYCDSEFEGVRVYLQGQLLWHVRPTWELAPLPSLPQAPLSSFVFPHQSPPQTCSRSPFNIDDYMRWRQYWNLTPPPTSPSQPRVPLGDQSGHCSVRRWVPYGGVGANLGGDHPSPYSGNATIGNI